MNDADLLIVGGGPAGMMAGLLFARAGVRTLVLEKHGDFLRDFRGDTVHPSTLDLLDELGLLEAFLQRPHDEAPRVSVLIGGRSYNVADFRHLKAVRGFIAMMPQWEFLDFVAAEARKYPSFELRQNCEVTGLATADQQVTGVTTADGQTLSARLVLACDGRGSVLRKAAGLPLLDLGAPIDVFWFRVPKLRTRENGTTGVFQPGQMVVLIDRGDYWQCAYVIAKGSADAVRERGLPAFRDKIAGLAPTVADAIGALTSWDDVKLLAVSLDRLTRWHRPGLLAIGDAAHAMSPVGGVGINLAMQDAVATANILAAEMARGEPVDGLLAHVEARRLFPVKVIQGLQRIVHTRVLEAALLSQASTANPPLAIRVLDRVPLLQRLPAYVIGMGVRREHIHSPRAPTHEAR
ncbi:FAD-dependent oxidoreductase [Sphingosinicellaceae bacterium]|nr:FAD-dependent oxidoreductase [Sphingosinicellaceae bacterium]